MSGDPAVLANYRAARAEFAKQASIFKAGGKDAGGKAIVKILDEQQASASQVADLLIGHSAVADKAQTIQLVKRINDSYNFFIVFCNTALKE